MKFNPTVIKDLNPIVRFAMQYLSHWLVERVPEFHMEWYDGFADKSIQRLVIEAMRGGAKSTVCKIVCLYWLCEGDETQYQLITRSGGSTGLSTLWLGDIKRELETNELIKADYGLRQGKHWGQERIQVIRPDGKIIDFWCRGKGSGIRGFRGTLIIDDPQNIGDCRSETILSGDEDWFFSDVRPVMLKASRLIFIATPISPLSLCSKVKQLAGWKVMSFPLEDANGNSIWVEQYGPQEIKDIISDIGWERYQAEYLCKPRVSGNPVFQLEWMKTYDPESAQFDRLRREGLYIVTGFDGAESKASTADETAIVTIAATTGERPDFYVIEVKHHHWSTKEGAEELFLTFDKQQQHKTIVESRCNPPNKDAIIEEIEEREEIYGKNINLYQIKPTRDKVTRAHGVQSFFQEGRVYFDETNKNHQALINQLIMFTGEGLFGDDMVDGCVYSLAEHKARIRGGVGEVRAKKVRHGKVSRHTGMRI